MRLRLQLAHRLRSRRRNAAALVLGARSRGWRAARRFLGVRRALVALQARHRGGVGRYVAKNYARESGARRLQAAVRARAARALRARALRAAVTLQCAVRGRVARATARAARRGFREVRCDR